MELFPATDEDAWTLIKSVIDDSDYYLLVVGGKYGSIDAVDDVGFTEKEFDYAISIGKPVMAFLHGSPESLRVKRSETSEDMQQRLAAFRSKVEATKHVKFWTSSEDLAGKVAVSLNKLVRQYPAVGWVRGDVPASVEMLAQLGLARERIDELAAELARVQAAPPPGTEGLAQGEDAVSLDVTARGSFAKKGNLGLVRPSVPIIYETTWDDLLGAVAPAMLVDAEQESVRGALQRAAGERMAAHARTEVQKAALLLDPSLDVSSGPKNMSIELSEEALGAVVLQFKALGLIEASSRKRSVADSGTYWSLTPLGEQRIVQTRAIRKHGY